MINSTTASQLLEPSDEKDFYQEVVKLRGLKKIIQVGLQCSIHSKIIRAFPPLPPLLFLETHIGHQVSDAIEVE